MPYKYEEEDLYTFDPDPTPPEEDLRGYEGAMKSGLYKDVTLDSFNHDRRKQMKNKMVKRIFFIVAMYSMHFSLVEMWFCCGAFYYKTAISYV